MKVEVRKRNKAMAERVKVTQYMEAEDVKKMKPHYKGFKDFLRKTSA